MTEAEFELPIPADAVEFTRMYNSHEACAAALIRARWRNGFVCPSCKGSTGWWRNNRPLMECGSCGYLASATAGTIFHATKLPLDKAFRIVYLMVATKTGISAMELSRQAGVNYKTAELWMRKTRTLMVREEREHLSGKVEVDEAIVGGWSEESPGRSRSPNKSLVLVMAEDNGKDGIGRIRLRQIKRASADHINEALSEELAPKSTVRTDGWSGYLMLRKIGMHHQGEMTISPSKSPKQFPLVSRVTSLLKRYLLGTLQGSHSHRWLQSILDEFVFRFNRRRSERRPLLFARILEEGLRRRPPTRIQLRNTA